MSSCPHKLTRAGKMTGEVGGRHGGGETVWEEGYNGAKELAGGGGSTTQGLCQILSFMAAASPSSLAPWACASPRRLRAQS